MPIRPVQASRHCALNRILPVFVLAFTFAGAIHAQDSSISFDTSQPVPFANACNNAFAGHFHKSTLMDFMTTCSPTYPSGATPNNTVQLNQGNGTFKPVEDTAIFQTAVPVAVADMNGDGYTDLVLNQSYTTTIGVQLSNGDGTFKAPVYYTPSNPNGQLDTLVVGDFNGDGKPDVAMIVTVPTTSNTRTSPNTLYIFLNTGSGELKQTGSYALNSTPAFENFPLLAAGSLNNDNRTDLVVVYRTSIGTAVPYFSAANGAFTKGDSYSVGPSPEAVSIGKFTGSGYGDIAVTSAAGVTMLLGSSSGTFTRGPLTEYPTPVTFWTGMRLATGDFDKDGNLDLAMVSNDFVYVLWGKGNGSFSGTNAYSVSALPEALIAADINGDGYTDLSVAQADGSLSILYDSRSDRAFRGTINTASTYAAGVVAGSFTGNGKKGIAVVNTPTCKAPCNGKVTVFPGTGGTSFGSGNSYSIGMHGSAIAAGDVNGDGIPDLVVTNATPGDNADTSVLLGIKSGGFHAAKNYTLGYLSNMAWLVDVNQDGKLDLVEVGGVALGKGDGTFGPFKPYPVGGSVVNRGDNAGFTEYVGVGHFSGHAYPDIALAVYDDNRWNIYELLNDGKGNFTATQLNDSNGLIANVTGLVVGKLASGGQDDIVLANNSTDSNGVDYGDFVIFNGNGKGGFAEANIYGEISDGGFLGAVTIADFNHDGIPDIGLASTDRFVVVLGQGGENFSNPRPFPITAGSTTNEQGNLVVADFNGDGWPDAVITNSYGIARLYNVPSPSVSPSYLSYNGAGTQKVTVKNVTSTAQSIQAGIAGNSLPPFEIVSNTCGKLSPDASCTIGVEYLPNRNGSIPAGSSTLFVSANSAIVAEIALQWQ